MISATVENNKLVNSKFCNGGNLSINISQWYRAQINEITLYYNLVNIK